MEVNRLNSGDRFWDDDDDSFSPILPSRIKSMAPLSVFWNY